MTLMRSHWQGTGFFEFWSRNIDITDCYDEDTGEIYYDKIDEDKKLRDPDLLDSSEGISVSDVDKVYKRYEKWMMLEYKTNCNEWNNKWEKGKLSKGWQEKIYGRLHRRTIFRSEEYKEEYDDLYYGFHLIQVENYMPSDGGRIYLDGCEIAREDLIKFLRFEADIEMYKKCVLPEEFSNVPNQLLTD